MRKHASNKVSIDPRDRKELQDQLRTSSVWTQVTRMSAIKHLEDVLQLHEHPADELAAESRHARGGNRVVQ